MRKNSLVFILCIILLLSGCGGGGAGQPQTAGLVLVDDFAGTDVPGRMWYYSRIGTDRGAMGDGSYTVELGGGSAEISVTNGWAGVWTSLIHNATTQDELDPQNLLGFCVLPPYQPCITGIKMHIIDGTGALKIEFKNLAGDLQFVRAYTLAGGERTIEAGVELTVPVKFMNIVLDGPGSLVYDKVWLKVQATYESTLEAAFLYSYGHLLQCYDPDSGLVRDRANWPAEDFASIQTIGTFALATTVACQLGYVDLASAAAIVQEAKETILDLPTYHGLLPHFLTDGAITANTEWSSVDSVICLTSAILACQYMGVDATALEDMVKAIDWADLTAGNTRPISHGYSYAGGLLSTGWDTFGSETFLAAMAFAACTGQTPVMTYPNPPTWDGSGFNDELAALFAPMDLTDIWDNDWASYRGGAAQNQVDNFAGHQYGRYGLFGLSAGEVPEPWTVAENDVYGAWGMGGRIAKNDGSALIGMPIVAPHYAAMVARERPAEAAALFGRLQNGFGILTPLNNVESLCLDGADAVRWNSLKGSWNLSLQTLGLGRALCGTSYGPHASLSENAFLAGGYAVLRK